MATYARLTHVDGAGEHLRLGKHGEAVREFGHVVAGFSGLRVQGLHVLERHGGVVLVGRKGGGASVDGVENSVEDAGAHAAGHSETLGLPGNEQQRNLRCS